MVNIKFSEFGLKGGKMPFIFGDGWAMFVKVSEYFINENASIVDDHDLLVLSITFLCDNNALLCVS